VVDAGLQPRVMLVERACRARHGAAEADGPLGKLLLAATPQGLARAGAVARSNRRSTGRTWGRTEPVKLGETDWVRI
jgi:hypothetical protein